MSEKKKIALEISGEIESDKEVYQVGLLEVLSLPDEINENHGKRAIHASYSTDLRNFLPSK